MTNERNNPWAGLASYEDPAKSERKLKFCGRDNDIFDVTRLIDDNLLLILYGKSGIGKTSLLNAGVFPELRKEQYLPVSIRLGTLEVSASYQEAIVYAIEKAIEEARGSITVYHVVEEQTDNHQPDLLWNYFARHRFANAEGQPLFPVVVLDQFEEVLRNTSPEHVEKAQTLLNQLQYLIDESHALNDCVVDGQDYFYDFNFRFIISIREDELYLLEDNIDDLSLSMFRNCRYRLRSLSEQGATEAILLPGKDCIVEEQKQAVVDRVIELSKRPQSSDIDTLLLSLVCASSFDKKTGEKITLSDLVVWKSNPMEVYYQDAIKGLSANQVRYIQQHLIREDGSRRRVDAAEVKTALGEATYRQLTQGANRLFALGDKGLVELLHDQLGMAVWEERKAFEERERKRRLRRRVTAISLILLAIAGIIFFQNYRLKQQRWKMMENQARLVAKEVIANAKNDSYLARMIALGYLLNDTYNKYEAIVPEFESALRTASTYNSAVFIGHTAAVTSTCFSPDGRSVLSTSYDNTIKLWDACNGECLNTFVGHTDIVNKAAFCPNLSIMASCSNDSTIKIWDLKSSNIINNLIGHENAVYSVVFSPDGEHVLSASEDATVRIWDVKTGECLNVLKGHEKMVESASYSPDGNIIASSSQDATIKLWDANRGICIKTLLGHKGHVQSVEFSPDGLYIVSASRDSTVKIWNVDSGECIRTLRGHSDVVQYASYDNTGKLIASSSDDATTRIWDASSGCCVDLLKGHTIYVTSPHFSPDSRRIVTGSVDNTVRIWDFGMVNKNDCVVMQSAIIKRPHFSPDGSQIVFVSNDSIWICDVHSRKRLYSVNNSNHRYADASYDAKGLFYAISANYDSVYVLDSTTITWSGRIKSSNNITAIAICPNNRQIAIASSDRLMQLWDMLTERTIKTIETQSVIKDISFSHDGAFVITTSQEGVVCVYNLDNPMYNYKLDAKNTAKNNAIISQNNNEIITCCDKVLYAWDIKTGTVIRSFQGHTARIYGFALSNDGKYLITVSHDSTIKIWDYKSGVCVQNINDEQHRYVSFSPDGKCFVTISLDHGSVIVWDFPPLQDLIDQTRERFKDRPLTPEERRLYYLE